MSTITYTVYRAIPGTMEGEALVSGLTHEQAAEMVAAEFDKDPETYVWPEKEIGISSERFDACMLTGEDLETMDRNAFEEDRANHDAVPQWQTRRVVAIGDETGITAVAPDYSAAVTNWLGDLGEQYAVDASIADDNRAMRGVM